MTAYSNLRFARRFGGCCLVIPLLLAACSSGGSATPDPAAEVAEGDAVAADPSVLETLAADPPPLDTPFSAWLPELTDLDAAQLGPVVDLLVVGERRAFAELSAKFGAQGSTEGSAEEGSEANGPSRHPREGDDGTGFVGVGAVFTLLGALADGADPGAIARGEASQSFGNDKGNGEFSMSLGVGRTAEGRSVFDMGFGVSAKEAKNGGFSGKFAFDAKTEVNACPDADGVVKFDYEITLKGEASAGGTSGGGSTHAKGTATARVDDAAYINDIQLDMKIEHVQRTDDGRDVYVEVAWSPGMTGGQLGVSGTKWTSGDAFGQVLRHSSKARRADVDPLFKKSSKLASEFVLGFLLGLQVQFRGGRCVQVVASAPTSVGKQQAVPIEVSTRHKLDRVDLTLPVDATVAGAGSLDTQRLPATSATLTYTSGTNDGDSGTITLVSTSKRGIGRLTLTVGVAATRYRVSGGGDGLEVSGEVGALDRPFSISGTFPGAEISFDFAPADARSGSVVGAFSGSGVSGSVTGDYTITGDAPGPYTLTMTTSGCVDGIAGSCRTTTSVITLTPIS